MRSVFLRSEALPKAEKLAAAGAECILCERLVSLSFYHDFALLFWKGAVSASIFREGIAVCNCERGFILRLSGE